MPHTALTMFNTSTLTTSGSTTYYESVCGYMRLYLTESAMQIPTRTAGTLTRLAANYSSTPGTVTLVSRVGGSNGGMSVSPGGSGITTDATNHDTLSAGNLINTAWTTGATGNAPNCISLTFAAGSGLTIINAASAQAVTANQLPSNSTIFLSVVGDIVTTTATDGRAASRFHMAGTAKNYVANVGLNGSNTAITLTLRRNAATDLAVTVSVTALTTGAFEDTLNTASIAADDLIELKKSGGQSGSSNGLASHAFWLDYTSGNKSDLLAQTVDSSGAVYSASTANRFMNTQGALDGSNATESAERVIAGFNSTWSNLRWFIRLNSATNTVTVTSRIGGVSKAQTFSVATTLTGEFKDDVNTDSVSQGDALTVLFVGTSAISGSITYHEITSALNDTSGSTFTDSVSEALSLTETNSATADFHSGISGSEALSLVATNQADVNDNVSDSDALGLTDTNSCVAIFNVDVSESLGLTDTNAGTKIAEESHYVAVIWHSQIG